MKPSFFSIKNFVKCCLSVSTKSSTKPDLCAEDPENVEMKAMFDRSAATQEQADEPIVLGKYSLEKKLGSGAFGTVYLSKHRESKKLYAGKLYDVEFIKDTCNMDLINSEMKILKRLCHKNTISFVDLVYSRRGVLLVMELVEGRDLNDLVPANIGIVEPFARIIFLQLMDVVKYLHSQRIVHRDIKIDNLLVNNRGILKLVDYGLSDLVPTERYEKDGLLVSGIQGTRSYYPPEIVRAIKTEDDSAQFIGDKIDIWTSGVLLYSLVSGKHPFPEESEGELMHDISCANIDYDVADFSPELEHLLQSILKVEPLERASAEEILKHPWSRDERFEDTIDTVFTSQSRRFEVRIADRAPKKVLSCPRNFPKHDRLRVFSPMGSISCTELSASLEENSIDTTFETDQSSSNSTVGYDCNSLSVECDDEAASQDEKLRRRKFLHRKLQSGYFALISAIRDFRDILRGRSVRLDLCQSDTEQWW